jgi:hypothetical protein
MRTTNELIAELRNESTGCAFVLLVVGFERESKMVSSNLNDTDALEELNALVRQGGHPLGFLRATKTTKEEVGKSKLSFATRVLEDHHGEAATIAHRVLTKLVQTSAQALEAEHGVKRLDDDRN